MIVKKKANQLRVGDKILGETNWWRIVAIRNSTYTGNTYPIIDVLDSFNKKRTIETGANEKFQDHIYEVETER